MWTNPQFPAELFLFTKEILNGKLHFCANFWVCRMAALRNRQNLQERIFDTFLLQQFIWKFSSVRKQKGSLKAEVTRQQSTPNFPKNEHFLPWTHKTEWLFYHSDFFLTMCCSGINPFQETVYKMMNLK